MGIIVRQCKERKFVVSYSVVWANITMEIDRLASTLECDKDMS